LLVRDFETSDRCPTHVVVPQFQRRS
jgi:hypothetical protein